MSNSKKAFFNWSGGKDSALALFYMLQEGEYDIVALLTSVNAEHNRVSMHGVRKELLKEQVKSIRIPLETLELPGEVSMQQYDLLVKEKVTNFKNRGIATAVFGDIFLEDLRAYREQKLAEVGITAIFPLWKKDTTATINELIEHGFKAIVVCVDAKLLDKSFAGRLIDKHFLADLPPNVDPCGENGEFHTFVFDGPIFKNPVVFRKGEIVFREYNSNKNADWNSAFWFCDLEKF